MLPRPSLSVLVTRRFRFVFERAAQWQGACLDQSCAAMQSANVDDEGKWQRSVPRALRGPSMKRMVLILAVAAVAIAQRPMQGQGGPPPNAGARDYIVVLHDDERNVPGVASGHARAY